MKIADFRSEEHGPDRTRVAATVTWEDCDRPEQDVYFETTSTFAQDLSCNPHAFLIGCAIPAFHYGETRVHLDAEVCPELLDGLSTVMRWLRHWYYEPDRQLVRIEARPRADLPMPRTPERAGFFFSGGIDSFATLGANRLNFPLTHPWSIKDALVVYGLELDQPDAFDLVIRPLSQAAHALDLTLIPIYTNLYLNYREEDAANKFDFWTYEFQGAVLAAVAHVMAQRLTVVSIASTFDIEGLGPWGSHPVLDPNYSSFDLRIRHDNVALSRLEKTKLVADWEIPLPYLRVCNRSRRYQPEMLNCGCCEKCVRTMLGLLALGALEKTSAFPTQHVSAELVRKAVTIHNPFVESCYLQLISPLAQKGYHDLVRAIEHNIAVYHDQEPGWRAKLKRFDHKYFNGELRRVRDLMTHTKTSNPRMTV